MNDFSPKTHRHDGYVTHPIGTNHSYRGGTRRKGEGHGAKASGKTSPTYQTWQSMKRRCLNPNDPKYQNYGAEQANNRRSRWRNRKETK